MKADVARLQIDHLIIVFLQIDDAAVTERPNELTGFRVGARSSR
jgi:hypothetical protein